MPSIHKDSDNISIEMPNGAITKTATFYAQLFN